MSMTLSEELVWRGFVNQTTYADLSELDKKKVTFYMGFDASADSQAVGNLAAMMFAKTLLRHGYPGILLAGGSTSLIGDPGGKDIERPLQDEKTIARNVARAAEQIKKILHGHKFTLVNNLDWTKDMKVIPFLRDIGKHFSMTPLVQRDYIAKRIGEGGAGISYAEFSYTILQGMDYLHLYDKHKVTLQLGGSDQWGNCLSGVDLIRRARGAETHVITLPLVINKATGKKFGKSEEGAVWLDADKTSVYQFYQFWLNADDEGVEGYLKLFTELDKQTIDEVIAEFKKDKAARLAQKTLAYETTKLVHGKEKADSVKRVSEVLFGGGEYGSLQKTDFILLADELPSVIVKSGTDLTEVLVMAALASSKSEARRFLDQGAVYLNGKQQPADIMSLDKSNTINGHVILRRGKNSIALLRIQ
jgi:tyrosyl-tRNA synthetase